MAAKDVVHHLEEALRLTTKSSVKALIREAIEVESGLGPKAIQIWFANGVRVGYPMTELNSVWGDRFPLFNGVDEVPPSLDAPTIFVVHHSGRLDTNVKWDALKMLKGPVLVLSMDLGLLPAYVTGELRRLSAEKGIDSSQFTVVDMAYQLEKVKNKSALEEIRQWIARHSSSSATKSALKTASAAAILQALVQAEGSAEAAAELVASGRVQDRFENDGDWGSVAREFGDSRFDQDALESLIDIAKDLYRKNPAKYDNNVWKAFSAARDANRMYEYNLYKLQKDTGLTWRAFEAKHHDDLKTSGVMSIIWEKYR